MPGRFLTATIAVSRWLWNTLFHQCLAVVAIYVVWVPIVNFHYKFSWHVILCTLGLIPLMAEALILYTKDNVWSQEIERRTKHWIHGILIAIASGFVIAGIAIEIDYGNDFPEAEHFTTTHGITGLLAMILLIFAMLGGLLAFNSLSLNKYVQPMWFKLLHNFIGQIALIMSIISLCFGYYTDWFVHYTSVESRLAATIVTGLLCFWSLCAGLKSGFHQIKAIIS